MSVKFDFSDHSVLVTGATSGIGEATAKAFARAGAAVMISGRDVERGTRVLSSIRDSGGRAEFTAGDITDSDCCDQLVITTVASFSHLDVVVNCAGVIYHATAEETTNQQWLHTMDVNVNGLFYMCRAAIAQLRLRRGAIINIASDAGLTGSSHLTAYCASKGAVVQMSRAMAMDYAADGVRVIPICPGDVDTPMLRGEFRDRGVDSQTGLAESAAAVPLQKVCTPGEVADLVLYAASSSAQFMTGYPLVIDGGSRA